MRSCLSITLLFATSAYSAALPGIHNHWSDPYSLRPNPLYPYYVRSTVTRSQGTISTYDSRLWKDSDVSPSRTRRSTKNLKFRAGSLQPRQDASTTSEQYLDTRPTPDPTGVPSIRTTVFIASEKDFALLLPKVPGGMFEFCNRLRGARRDQRFLSELVSDAEMDAVTYCAPGSSSDPCENRMPDGLITAASVARAEDDSWIQVLSWMFLGRLIVSFRTLSHRSLAVSTRASFTLVLATLVDRWTCASRMELSVLSAGQERALSSCACQYLWTSILSEMDRVLMRAQHRARAEPLLPTVL